MYDCSSLSVQRRTILPGRPHHAVCCCKHQSWSEICWVDDHRRLAVLSTLSSLGDRSFATAGPRAWNKLPSHLRLMQSADTFRRHLKTFYLTRPCYHNIVRHGTTTTNSYSWYDKTLRQVLIVCALWCCRHKHLLGSMACHTLVTSVRNSSGIRHSWRRTNLCTQRRNNINVRCVKSDSHSVQACWNTSSKSIVLSLPTLAAPRTQLTFLPKFHFRTLISK